MGTATSVRAVKEVAPSLPVMGNVSTMKLHLGNPAWVEARAERLLAEGVDILAQLADSASVHRLPTSMRSQKSSARPLSPMASAIHMVPDPRSISFPLELMAMS